MTVRIVQADAVEFLRAQPEGSLDLVFGSPPYMDARTYGINAQRDCVEWVAWMLDVTDAAAKACRGLVLWVVGGVQRDNCYWPGCEGLAWEWWKRGGDCHLWRPVVWWKVDESDGGTGIPGSGGNVPGKRWLRADWEYVLCFKKPGGIPYDHPEVMGHEPYYGRIGGEMSNRTADGRRANDRVGDGVKSRRGTWNTSGISGLGGRRQNGKKKTRAEVPHTKRKPNGEVGLPPHLAAPKVVNPGNVLPLVVKARVGGGHMGGHNWCSQNEAPFPEPLAEFFVLTYSAPGSLVSDPFSGSGTTATICKRHGRNFTGCDLRQSQVELGLRRVAEETPLLFNNLNAEEAPDGRDEASGPEEAMGGGGPL